MADNPHKRPHLAGVVSLGGTRLGAAGSVSPARLLQEVGGLLPGLPRHDEVNLLLAGLWGEAECESHGPGTTNPCSPAQSVCEMWEPLQRWLDFPLMRLL